MNAVIPYGIGVNTPQQVVAVRGSSISVPPERHLGCRRSGYIHARQFREGQGSVVRVDAAGQQILADSGHPAQAGDVLVIYCTGLGEVDPPATAGQPASLTQLSRTVNPVALSIGGVPATVQFSGLAPGFIGLYQANAIVASGISAGDQVPVVLSAAGHFSAPVCGLNCGAPDSDFTDSVAGDHVDYSVRPYPEPHQVAPVDNQEMPAPSSARSSPVLRGAFRAGWPSPGNNQSVPAMVVMTPCPKAGAKEHRNGLFQSVEL